MRPSALVLCALSLLGSLGSARAQYVTYSEWEALSDINRAMYVGGAYDTLVSTIKPGEKYQRHYSQCVTGAKMTLSQLSQNVRTYGSTHPKYQGMALSGALIGYLIELCGQAPD
jgi:hypothetical protein